MDSKVREKLQELFTLYTKNLPSKIANIERKWQEQLQEYNIARFHDFHRDIHSLCGSAGTYGYTELGQAARELEIYLKSLLNKELLTPNEKERIQTYLKQINAVLSTSLSKKLPVFHSQTTSFVDNKLVFILEKETKLVHELSESLRQSGYSTQSILDLNSLAITVQNNLPIAIIIDTEFLDKEGINRILDMQKQLLSPIQLFGIIPDADLLPRLQAVRAGCSAFFQKPVDIFDLTQMLNQKCSHTGEAYRILIIDDSESLAQYYSLILSQVGMVTHTLSNPLNLLHEMESFLPDLLLMDIYMPECNGLELAAVLRQESRYTKIPIIFLSTEDDARKKLSAISLGGDDFLTKPVTEQHLISAVRSRAKRAGVLNYYMTTDSLTGLLNHSSVLKQLDVELMHSRQKKIPLSFIMIDIDFFKKINDTYGHPIGDIVIKKLATLLLVRLRRQDIVGRYGGEEFAIILPGADGKKSKIICEELRDQFAQFVFAVNDNQFSVTFSAGISSFNNVGDGHTIIEEADKALYQAKQMGRNQAVIFTEENSSSA